MFKGFYHIARISRKHWLTEAALLLLIMTGSLCALASPYILKVLIDDVFPSRNALLLANILLLLVGIYVVRIGIAMVTDRIFIQLTNRIVTELRYELFEKVLRADVASISSSRPTDFSHIIFNEVEKVKYIITNMFIRVVNNFFLIAGIVVALAWLNLPLLLISCLAIPLLVVNSRFWLPKISAHLNRVTWAESNLNTFLVERIQSIKHIRTCYAQEVETKIHQSHLDEVSDAALRSGIYGSFNKNLSTFIIAIGPVMVFWWGGSNVLLGEMTIGELVAFVQYLSRLYNPSFDMMNIHNDLVKASIAFEQIETIRNLPAFEPEIERKKISRFNQISLTNVSLSDNGRDILKDISFNFTAGKKYGIVGLSGAGKSSLIHLVSRFIKPTSGTITVDGVDLQNIDAQSWAGLLKTVYQNAELFSDSVRYNINYGFRNAGSNDTENAAAKAFVLEAINTLPDKLDSRVNQKGYKLSGGEIQRIALARIFVNTSQLLILDEWSSSIDAETENKLLNSICSEYEGKTIILITHRVNILSDVDEIICINRGRIETTGSPSALQEGNNIYSSLLKELNEPAH